MLRDSGTGDRIVQGVSFPPLRTNAGSKRLLRSGIVFGGGNTRLQGLQHGAVSSLFDALRQGIRLCSGTVDDVFDGGSIGCIAEGGADLLRDSGTGGRIVQGMRFLPLCTNTGGERLLRGGVVLRDADARLQGLQHRAVGFLPHPLRQDGSLNGNAADSVTCRAFAGGEADAGGLFARALCYNVMRSELYTGTVGSTRCCPAWRGSGLLLRHFFSDAVQDGFNGGTVGFGFATEGGDDALRHGVAGGFVLQALFLPVGTDAGGEGILCFGALCVTDIAAQGVQHIVVVVRADADGDFPRFFSGTVQDGFDQCAVLLPVTTEDGGHLFGNSGSNGAVLQAVLVLPLVADGGRQHLLHVGAGCVAEAGTQGVHHDAVGVLTYTFRQHTRYTVRHSFQHGIQHGFIGHAFFQQRGFELTDDGVTGLAFGVNALLQPLAADGVGQYSLHVFIRPCGKTATQGGEHTVIGFLRDAGRRGVYRYPGHLRYETGLHGDGGIAGGVRLGEDARYPLRLSGAVALEGVDQALRHRRAHRGVVCHALLPLAADSFRQRRLHIGIRLAHAQTALQGAQGFVVTFAAADAADTGGAFACRRGSACRGGVCRLASIARSKIRRAAVAGLRHMVGGGDGVCRCMTGVVSKGEVNTAVVGIGSSIVADACCMRCGVVGIISEGKINAAVPGVGSGVITGSYGLCRLVCCTVFGEGKINAAVPAVGSGVVSSCRGVCCFVARTVFGEGKINTAVLAVGSGAVAGGRAVGSGRCIGRGGVNARAIVLCSGGFVRNGTVFLNTEIAFRQGDDRWLVAGRGVEGDIVKGSPVVCGIACRSGGSGCLRACCAAGDTAIGEAQFARQGIQRVLPALWRIKQGQADAFGD